MDDKPSSHTVKSKRRSWVKLIGLALFAITWAIVLLLFMYVHRLTHPGCRSSHATPEDVGIADYREVHFDTTDGLTLGGWYVPSHNGAVIIILPAPGTARDNVLLDASIVARHGYGVLIFDARTCAGPGIPSTLGFKEVHDVAGALAFVRAQPDADPQRIGVWGFSAGAAAALLSAAQFEDLRAIIAVGSFDSLRHGIVSGHGIISGDVFPIQILQELAMLFYRLDTGVDAHQVSPLDHVAKISPHPILLIYGEHEFEQAGAERLFNAAREPKDLWIVPGAGHGGYFWVAPEEFERRVVNFFDKALLSGSIHQ